MVVVSNGAIRERRPDAAKGIADRGRVGDGQYFVGPNCAAIIAEIGDGAKGDCAIPGWSSLRKVVAKRPVVRAASLLADILDGVVRTCQRRDAARIEMAAEEDEGRLVGLKGVDDAKSEDVAHIFGDMGEDVLQIGSGIAPFSGANYFRYDWDIHTDLRKES